MPRSGGLISFQAYAEKSKHILFAGSSSIQFWSTLDSDFSQYTVVNEGVGGWTYKKVAAAMPGFIKKADYDAVVLYAGDNDISFGQSTKTVLKNFKKVVSIIRSNKADMPIIVMSVKLSPLRPFSHRRYIELNKLLEAESLKDSNLLYVDVQSRMSGQTGIFRDGIHMTRKGYKIWANEVNNALDRLRL